MKGKIIDTFICVHVSFPFNFLLWKKKYTGMAWHLKTKRKTLRAHPSPRSRAPKGDGGCCVRVYSMKQIKSGKKVQIQHAAE